MTARERFTQTMRELNQIVGDQWPNLFAVISSELCDAFADQECGLALAILIRPATEPLPSHTEEQHEMCRASLRRECGLDDRCAPLPGEETPDAR